MTLFLTLAALSILSSLLVVFQRNVVRSAIALVAALFLTALLFLTLEAPMIGVLQILVYAGAIMVLFLFVIMLLNPASLERRRIQWWGGGTLGALILLFLLVSILSPPLGVEPGAGPRGESFGGPEPLARALFGDFVLPFEIASILLLVAIVGAVVLAQREG